MLTAGRTAFDRLLEGYRPSAEGVDELVDASGRARPHWEPILAELSQEEPAAMTRRFGLADRHLRNSGVFYRVYDPSGGGERPWPLAHMPLVIPAAEWQTIEAGIMQRARLLEVILADLYGPARLVKDGALPAAVVAGNPDFLRPIAGAVPRGGEHLVIYAADLGRAPDGQWWILGDRAQAPSGMGYAVENRLALATVLPSLLRDMQVERLAGFFQALRSVLAEKADREGSRIALLTPGPANETYFEHAYLARYLGFLLVEGGDLLVQDGIVYVRTIEGLKRIEVLMRRLDADFCDPLEFTASSRIGVPGLVRAVRAGTIALANGLGAGLVEARAMLAFVPALARRLIGEELLLPNVATWWCGDEHARLEVMSQMDRLEIHPAFSRRVGGLAKDGSTRAADLDADERQKLPGLLLSHPLEIVAQEVVKLSTMPVWTGRGLRPRPFTLRVFAVSTPEGWRVMRGGFCRVAESDDPQALSMQRGGRSADVWVTANKPVEPVTLLPPPGRVTIRRRLGHLPSRAADNLFWLGRYLERAEATLRLVRTIGEMSIETSGETSEALRRLAALLVAWGATAHHEGAKVRAPAKDPAVVLAETMAGDSNGAVPVLVRAAARTASVIRERLSPDATQALDDLRTILGAKRDQPPAERADRALRVLAALSGLAQENMNRISGWRFMQIGRRLERGILTARMARGLADANASEETLDALLKVTDSRITYRARYLMGTLRLPVLDLVVLDDGNPRSVAFQIGRLAEHLAALPGAAREGEIDAPGKAIRILRTAVETSDAGDVDEAMLLSIENRLLTLSDDVTTRYFGHGEVQSELSEGLG
jgi:uncharacterized circularly permuted ATP-grasp superfamily protein/uncharacterized alpha-E superfamily protein